MHDSDKTLISSVKFPISLPKQLPHDPTFRKCKTKLQDKEQN